MEKSEYFGSAIHNSDFPFHFLRFFITFVILLKPFPVPKTLSEVPNGRRPLKKNGNLGACHVAKREAYHVPLFYI